MADKPILFSAPMVQALLAGRKTQTRRLLKPYPCRVSDEVKPVPADILLPGREATSGYYPPRFERGDRLWVKETWRAGRGYDGAKPSDMAQFSRVWYEADGCHDNADIISKKRRPSIFMPRWASRLTLAVTDVRVQRLHECSEEDAVAEGIEPDVRTASGQFYRNYGNPSCPAMAYGSYRSLWDSINGQGAWDANPWVAALTFSVERQNIDRIGSEAA